jgi:hypothetical protein
VALTEIVAIEEIEEVEKVAADAAAIVIAIVVTVEVVETKGTAQDNQNKDPVQENSKSNSLQLADTRSQTDGNSASYMHLKLNYLPNKSGPIRVAFICVFIPGNFCVICVRNDPGKS